MTHSRHCDYGTLRHPPFSKVGFLIDATLVAHDLRKLASMLHREHICIEIGNPLLALLRDSKVAQRISDIRPDRLPEEIRIVSAQICHAIVLQLIAHSGLAKLVK